MVVTLLPEEDRPKWPWSGVTYPRTEDDTDSAKFAELKGKWNGVPTVFPKEPIGPEAIAEFVRQREVADRLRRVEKEYYERN